MVVFSAHGAFQLTYPPREARDLTVKLVLCKFRVKKWNEASHRSFPYQEVVGEATCYGKVADGVRSVVTVSKSHLESLTVSQRMEADVRKDCNLEAHDSR